MFKRVKLWKKHKGSIPTLGQGGVGGGPPRGQAAAIIRKGKEKSLVKPVRADNNGTRDVNMLQLKNGEVDFELGDNEVEAKTATKSYKKAKVQLRHHAKGKEGYCGFLPVVQQVNLLRCWSLIDHFKSHASDES
ncbi:hypothetical protein V7S43_016485 [Phytophthora oleae]|uniref:Uncharacterized protein n=1 Tax=Phytophthora oleae TaxID=2107226 RepID=A0ABD3EZ37_9STRA